MLILFKSGFVVGGEGVSERSEVRAKMCDPLSISLFSSQVLLKRSWKKVSAWLQIPKTRKSMLIYRTWGEISSRNSRRKRENQTKIEKPQNKEGNELGLLNREREGTN